VRHPAHALGRREIGVRRTLTFHQVVALHLTERQGLPGWHQEMSGARPRFGGPGSVPVQSRTSRLGPPISHPCQTPSAFFWAAAPGRWAGRRWYVSTDAHVAPSTGDPSSLQRSTSPAASHVIPKGSRASRRARPRSRSQRSTRCRESASVSTSCQRRASPAPVNHLVDDVAVGSRLLAEVRALAAVCAGRRQHVARAARGNEQDLAAGEVRRGGSSVGRRRSDCNDSDCQHQPHDHII